MPTNMLPPAYTIGPNGLTMFANGKHFAVNIDHPNYSQLLDAIRSKDWEQALKLVDIPKTVTDWFNGEPGFALDGDLVKLDGEAFSAAVSAKVLRMIRDKFDASPLLKFLRNVRANPSYSAQQELLLFCEANGFAITDDGCIIAYKLVRDDYKDHYTGTFDNSLGKVVEMPRHQVDDRRDFTCSRGLHFAAWEYAATQYAGGRGRLMAVKVNPQDVVSIPSDYKNQKGRCAKYEVVAELERQPDNGHSKLPQREVHTPQDIGRASWGLPSQDQLLDPDADEDDDEDDEHCLGCGRVSWNCCCY